MFPIILFGIFFVFLVRMDGVASQTMCPMDEPPNGRFHVPCQNAVGSTCRFSCFSSGGEPAITSSKVLTCTSWGKWSEPPMCVNIIDAPVWTYTPPAVLGPPIGYPRCPPLVQPDNSLMFGACYEAVVTQSCYFQCNAGFVMRGVSPLTCLGGKWNLPAPTCVPVGTGLVTSRDTFTGKSPDLSDKFL